MEHDSVPCIQNCQRPRPTGCSHACMKPFWQSCEDCMKMVKKIRQSCGHVLIAPCHKDVDNVNCSFLCGVMMLCEHFCMELCHNHNRTLEMCTAKCERTRSTCSNPCINKCFETCGDCLVSVQKQLD